MRTALPVLAVVFLGVAVAAPVPKDKKEDFGPITEEQLKQAEQRMKEFGLALHNYHDTYGFFPQNTTTKDGKPGLSWRVLLLPFFGKDQAKVFAKFKEDEAWDSEHNKKLIESMPDIFAPIRAKTKEKGQTFYQGFEGPGTGFRPGGRVQFAAMQRGTTNVVAVVEAGEAVVWTKPQDLPFDPKKDLPKLGGHFDGDFHMTLFDGSVRKVKAKFNAEVMKGLVQCAADNTFTPDNLYDDK